MKRIATASLSSREPSGTLAWGHYVPSEEVLADCHFPHSLLEKLWKSIEMLVKLQNRNALLRQEVAFSPREVSLSIFCMLDTD